MAEQVEDVRHAEFSGAVVVVDCELGSVLFVKRCGLRVVEELERASH